MTAQLATDRQTSYICSLAGVKFLSQLRNKGIYLTQSEVRGSLTKARASEIIDELLAR